MRYRAANTPRSKTCPKSPKGSPESFAALLNGQGVWIEGEPKQEKILGYSVHEAQARERDKQAKLDWELLG